MPHPKHLPLALIALSCAPLPRLQAAPTKTTSPKYLQAPGPIPNRKIDESKITLFVGPNGRDSNNGKSRKAAFATLQKAADSVKPGDKVLVLKGTYRQGLHIHTEGRADAWISFIAEPGATIEGADVRRDWVREPGGGSIYSIERPPLDDAWHNPDTSLQNRLEQVFVNGVLLRQVPERAMLKPKGVFWVDDTAKKLYACLENGADPNAQKTQVSMRTYAIAIGGPPNKNFWRDESVGLKNKVSYVRVDGFTVRHIADFSRMAAVQVRGLVHHVVIENCDVQWANYSGMAIDSMSVDTEDKTGFIDHLAHHITVRHCIVSNNGAQAIGGGGASDLLIENNIIDSNNYKGVSPWFEGGGVKTGFGGSRIVMRNNVARNNDNEGLWLDYGAEDCLIENNLVFNSLATGVLDEVTPAPPMVRNGGRETRLEVSAADVRAMKLKGTTIRNNIIIGTRTPSGNGISISNSVASTVTNNILYANAAAGIQMGGSPNRNETLGLWNNVARSNILDANFRHVETSRDAEDPKGRYFNNRFERNLFGRFQAPQPFRISGEDSTPEVWKQLNPNNTFADKPIFRDPERFDFTLNDPALAKKIGFDPAALRLDWRAFHVARPQSSRKTEARNYTPIDLSKYFNRALVDQKAGDGIGGWSDQGANDMSLLPLGTQVLDGVTYKLGTKEKGAILLDNTFVKPGGFAAEVSVPIGGKSFDEINFLYTSAWTTDQGMVNGKNEKLPTPEVARFVVRYEDGSEVIAPVVVGKQIMDWWQDPSWQEYAALNDNNTFVAWQGPNRSVGKVTLYYLKWPNPEPDKKIASVTISNRDAPSRAAFFVLGISGANRKGGATTAANPRVFHLGFDGEVDAEGSNGDIEALGFTKMAFDAGKFADGASGQSYIPNSPIYYPTPNNFPLQGRGTISLWLRAEDWASPERIAWNKEKDYTRIMTPFSIEGGAGRYSPWGIWFESPKENLAGLSMHVQLSGPEEMFDVAPLVRPNQWFQVTTTWQPQPGAPNTSLRRTYFNGKLLSEKVFGKPDVAGGKMYIGVPSNGGQPWRGAMDDLSIWNTPMTAEQVAAQFAAAKVPGL